MKILTLMGLLVLLTTSPTTNCIPGQFKRLPIPYFFPLFVTGFSGLGSNFGLLGCPSEYQLYSTKCGRFCYRIYSTKCRTWDDARKACKADGADLWLPDACSYPFFLSLARDLEVSCEDIWIGAFRTPTETIYKRLDGVPIPDNFTFWGIGEPDRGTQMCVQIEALEDNMMNDENCNDEEAYICQLFV